MLFKRFGAKKHKYQIQLTLSTIKYCSWNTPSIKIILIRGDHQVQSPQYTLYKGRCNLDNYVLSISCTMFFNDGKYLEKDIQIKIKAYNKDKEELAETLSKLKLDVVGYTDEDRPYEQQLNFDGAKLSCSFYMKLTDESAEDSNTQKSHLSYKTEKVGKSKDGKNRSTSKDRKALNFGKSNRLITEPDDVEINLGKDKKEKQKEGKGKQKQKQKQPQKQDRKEKRKESQILRSTQQKQKQSTRRQSQDIKIVKNKSQKDAQISTVGTKTKDKQKQKRQRQRQKDKIQEQQKVNVQQFQFKPKISRQSALVFSPLIIGQTPFKNSKHKGLSQQFIYQKQLQQKTQLMQSLQQQNQRLKRLLQQQVITQPIQTKQASLKIKKLEQQSEKFRQKVVEKQIQLSEYELKFKSGIERESKLITEKKESQAQARSLKEQLETVKQKIVEALTEALESGNSQLVSFLQDHFSFE